MPVNKFVRCIQGNNLQIFLNCTLLIQGIQKKTDQLSRREKELQADDGNY